MHLSSKLDSSSSPLSSINSSTGSSVSGFQTSASEGRKAKGQHSVSSEQTCNTRPVDQNISEILEKAALATWAIVN